MENYSAQIKTIAFFPWLILAKEVKIGNIHFVPFKTNGKVNPVLEAIEQPLNTILGSYVNLAGCSVSNATIVVRPKQDPPWNFFHENEIEIQNEYDSIRKATLFLLLAVFSKNEYFRQGGIYVNSAQFQFYLQNFTDPVQNLSFQSRRRDGLSLSAGYKHGEVKLTVPLQNKGNLSKTIPVDDALICALNCCLSKNTNFTRHLEEALSFFSLATTDSDFMLSGAEIILMGSAFEQLLATEGAYELSCSFGCLWEDYGNVLVEKCRTHLRTDIQIDREHEMAQKKWYVHRKWIQELHQLRSAYVHGEDINAKSWGWTVFEHLVMSAFVFPLAVKLLSAKEKYYTLTKQDKNWCYAVDQLLCFTNWAEEDQADSRSRWLRVLDDAARDRIFNQFEEKL